jgi:succinoglycan biosynthesis transport protein ExoP
MIPVQPSELDLNEVLGILRRQGRLIVLTVALLLLPAILYLMLATPMYQSTTLISIDAGGSNLLDPGSIENSQSAILNSRVDGEVEVLRADATVLEVVRAADLISDPEFGPGLGLVDKLAIAVGLDDIGNRLRRAVGLPVAEGADSADLLGATIGKLKAATDIRRRGQTYLISVTLRAQSPDRAAQVANAYVQSYIARQVVTKTAGIIAARDVLQSQTEIAQGQVNRLENGLNRFIDDNLARFEAESSSTTIGALRQQLETAKASKLQGVESLSTAREAAMRNDWLTVAQSLGDAALQDLARERDQLQRRLRGQTDGTQVQIDLQQALAGLEQNLNQRLAVAQTATEARASRFAQAETLAREQVRAALLQSDLSSAVVSDLFNLQQTATIARNQYQQLLARVQDLNAMANVQISDARVVSEALPPRSPATPNTRLVLVIALAVALTLGVMIAFVYEYYIGGVTSAAQLGNIIQAPVAVVVPDLNRGKENRLIADDILAAPLSPYAESFRKMRLSIDSNLHHSLRDRAAAGKGQVVLICSALPGEGKTTTAISLARTYAAAGLRTLLIDCDLRKPSVAGYLGLGLGQDHGLINYLDSPQPDADQIVKPVLDPLSDLAILAAGTRSSKPTDQLINNARFTALLDVVRDSYDIVILDSPPLLPVVDARYLVHVADITVQVVRFATTTQGEIREAASQIREFQQPGTRLLGVLSQHDRRTGKRGGYGSYYGE